MNIEQKVLEIIEVREREEALRLAKSETTRTREDLENKLCEHFRENMQTRIDMEGKKLKATVKAELKPFYTIKGGKLKEPEKKEEVIELLENLGYLPTERIIRYSAVEVSENTLQAAFRKLSIEQIIDLQDRGLISVYDKPKVSIKLK